MQTHIKAGDFKAKCLKLMNEVQETGHEYIITKHGKAVAKLVPIDPQETPLFGCMKGTAEIVANIMDPIEVEWEANAD